VQQLQLALHEQQQQHLRDHQQQQLQHQHKLQQQYRQSLYDHQQQQAQEERQHLLYTQQQHQAQQQQQLHHEEQQRLQQQLGQARQDLEAYAQLSHTQRSTPTAAELAQLTSAMKMATLAVTDRLIEVSTHGEATEGVTSSDGGARAPAGT
jgi:hypothetical protein